MRVEKWESFPGWPLLLWLQLLTLYCAVGNMTLCFGIPSWNMLLLIFFFLLKWVVSLCFVLHRAHIEERRSALILDGFYWVTRSPHPVPLGNGCSVPRVLVFSWIFGTEAEQCNNAGFFWAHFHNFNWAYCVKLHLPAAFSSFFLSFFFGVLRLRGLWLPLSWSSSSL